MNKAVLAKLGYSRLICVMMILCSSVVPAFAQKQDNTLIAMNECWRYPTSDIVAVGPAVDKSNLYIVEDGGRVTALAISGGIRLWSTELGGEVISNLVVAESSVYAIVLAASGQTRLRSLSEKTGIPSLDVPFLKGDKARLELAGGKVLGISTSGSVAAFDRASETQTWNKVYPNIVPGTAKVWDDKIAIATSDRRVILISAVTGDETAVVESDRPVSAISYMGGDLVWGDERGNVVRYDLDKRSTYWKFKNGAKISSLWTTDEAVLAASFDNFVYFIHPYFGSVKWKKRLAGRASDLIIGDPTFAVVLTVGEPNASLLNLENGKSAGQVALGTDESFLVSPIYNGGKYFFFSNKQVFAESTTPCSSK